MEETNQVAGGENLNPSGIDQKSEDKVDYSTYKKTVDQEKNLRKRLAELEEQNNSYAKKLEDISINEQQKKGNLEEVINSLRKQNEELRSGLDNKTSQYLNTQKKNAIMSMAKDRNCVNPNALVKLLDSSDLSTIQVGDDFEVNMEDVKMVLDKAEKENEFLFKPTNVRVSDRTPTNPDINKKPTKLSDLSKGQIDKAFSEMNKEQFDSFIKNIGKLT